MNWGNVSSGTAWFFLALCGLFEAASITAFLAASNFSLAATFDPAHMLRAGVRGANLVRSASFLDMFGYLAAIPIVLYLGHRFRGEPGIDFFTLAGILFLVFGALAAIVLAYAGAPLIREYATSSTGKYAMEKTFVALYRITVFGIWQTLDSVLAAIWGFGVAALAWRNGAKGLAWVLIAIGIVVAGGVAAHISGLFPGS